MPHVTIIAGPNGAGKTTSAPLILKDIFHVDTFVNADVIAQGLCAFKPESAAIQAGRLMLKRINELAHAGENFAFETTLASRSFSVMISEMKKKGYKFYLFYLWLKDANLAISRVEERIRLGGHSVPTDVIKRRYQSGLNNFFNLYKPMADFWQLIDNSDTNKLVPIASGSAITDEITIVNKSTWKALIEVHNEK